MNGESVLELDSVTKVYGEEPPVPALRGVSFSVRRGELVAIVGPSGSGKSTLLHVIGTLERPSSGVVRIGGVDAARLSDRELSRLRAREIGFVFRPGGGHRPHGQRKGLPELDDPGGRETSRVSFLMCPFCVRALSAVLATHL